VALAGLHVRAKTGETWRVSVREVRYRIAPGDAAGPEGGPPYPRPNGASAG
jgi:hypothetical protein